MLFNHKKSAAKLQSSILPPIRDNFSWKDFTFSSASKSITSLPWIDMFNELSEPSTYQSLPLNKTVFFIHPVPSPLQSSLHQYSLQVLLSWLRRFPSSWSVSSMRYFLAITPLRFHPPPATSVCFSRCYINSCSVSNWFKSSSSPTVLFGFFLYSCAARIYVPGRISIPSINRLLVSSPPSVCLILSLNLYTTLPLFHQNVSCGVLFSKDISCQNVAWRITPFKNPSHFPFSAASPSTATRSLTSPPFSSNPGPVILLFMESVGPNQNCAFSLHPPGEFSLMVPLCSLVIWDNVFTCCHCHSLARRSQQGV